MNPRSVTPKYYFAIIVLCCWWTGCKQKELEPTPPEPVRAAAVARPEPQFQPVADAAEGARQTTLATQSLPQLHSHLEIRTLLIQAGRPVTLPMPYEGFFEVRAGSLASATEGKFIERPRGDLWQFAKGERVTFEASGELAVVRAVYLVPGEK